ncbi:MAG: hypothetical protein ACRCWI_05745 [Brevinema sp.]
MKKLILIVSILCLLEACSTTSDRDHKDDDITLPGGGTNGGGTNGGGITNEIITLPDGVVGTGDYILDTGLKDALNQVESVRGFTQWELIIKDPRNKTVYNYFFDNNNYTCLTIMSANSILTKKIAIEGSIFTILSFIIKHGIQDVTKELIDERYTQIYTLPLSIGKQWSALTPIWKAIKPEDLKPKYFLVKETDKKRSFIEIDFVKGKEYKIYNSVEEELRNAVIYTKK